MVLLQVGLELLHGLTAMADPVFYYRVELCGCAPLIIDEKKGVVAKTVFANRPVENPAIPETLTDDRGGVFRVSHVSEDADKPCLPVRYALHVFKQQTVIAVVAGVFAGIAR